MKTHLTKMPLAAALLLAACGGTETKTIYKNRDVPADPCTIDTQAEGGPELVCPDGSRAKIPQGSGCTLMSQEGGSFLLTCGDQQAVIPAEGCTASPGTGGAFTLHCGGVDVIVSGPATTKVTGTAHLYGQTDASGISVALDGTAFAGTTDATGAFTIDGVPSGLYRLKASKDGWTEQSFDNVLIYGTTRTLEVELRRARLIQAASDASLQDLGNPVSDDALVLRIGSFPGRVALARAGASAVVWLDNVAGLTGFSGDGKYLISTGALWDVKAGTKIATSDEASQFWFSADGTRLAYQKAGGANFYVRQVPSGADTILNATIVNDRIFTRGGDFYYPVNNGDLWVLQAGAATPKTIGSNLGQVNSLTFTTGNRAIASSIGVGATALDEINVSTLAVKRIIPDVSDFRASADGARVAYVRFDSDLNALVVEIADLATTERRIADSTGTLAVSAMSADGRYLLYTRAGAGVQDWFIYDFDLDVFSKVLDQSSGSATFVAGDAHLLLQRNGDLVDYTVASKNERVIASQAALVTRTEGNNTVYIRSADGRFQLVTLDGPPRSAILDMQTLQITDLQVMLSSPAFSADSKALAGIGLGEAPSRVHVWTLPSMAHDTITGGADVFWFSPSGAEIVMRQIESGDDRLVVYRRDTKASVPLDRATISVLGVLDGEVIYLRRPGLGENPAPTAGVWSAPLR